MEYLKICFFIVTIFFIGCAKIETKKNNSHFLDYEDKTYSIDTLEEKLFHRMPIASTILKIKDKNTKKKERIELAKSNKTMLYKQGVYKVVGKKNIKKKKVPIKFLKV